MALLIDDVTSMHTGKICQFNCYVAKYNFTLKGNYSFLHY